MMARAIATVLVSASCASALVAPAGRRVAGFRGAAVSSSRGQPALRALPDDEELFGGFTAKQRLREEIESPFRKVRLLFFGASTGSALLAQICPTFSWARPSAVRRAQRC